jgi:hypothetical protein
MKGLYSCDISNKSLVKNYDIGRVEPDALEYTKFFYAKNHIPGIQNRPGNNSYATVEVYKKYLDNYNLQCYN